MTPLTVACLFVQGEFPYTPEYVIRLAAMVRRWIDRPYRFVCLTDQPWLFPDLETIVVSRLPGFAYWTKLELFNPARAWSGRVLYLDLDTLLVAPLSPILDMPAPFALIEDEPRPGQKTRDAFGRQILRRFNSSVMVWDGGAATELFTSWEPAIANRLSGDQDWIGERCPNALALPRAWFPRISEVRPPWPAEARVILVKKPKNAEAAQVWPWFSPLWGDTGERECSATINRPAGAVSGLPRLPGEESITGGRP